MTTFEDAHNHDRANDHAPPPSCIDCGGPLNEYSEVRGPLGTTCDACLSREAHDGGNEVTTAENTYVAALRRRAELTAALKSINAQISDLELEVRHDWAARGCSQQTVNGCAVYLSHELRMNSRNGSAAMVEAIQQAGRPDLLMPSSGRLRALVKELLTDEHTDSWELTNADRLPQWLSTCVDLAEIEQIKYRGLHAKGSKNV